MHIKRGNKLSFYFHRFRVSWGIVALLHGHPRRCPSHSLFIVCHHSSVTAIQQKKEKLGKTITS